MDLAEKRKQLEALRAARQAKQQVVDQYISGRLCNPPGSSFSSASLGSSVSAPAPPTASAASASAVAAATASVSKSVLPTQRSRSNGRRLSISSNRSTASAAAASCSAASSPVTSTTPRAQKAPTTTASKPSAPLLAQPSPPDATSSSPLIQVCSVAKESTSASARRADAAGADTAAASPTARSAVCSRCQSALRPSVPSTAAAAAAASPTPEGSAACEGWDFLRHCMGNVVRDSAEAAVAQPVCVFNPSVLLGDITRPVETSRRRVILDSTSCLVPYDGAVAGHQLGNAAMTVSNVVCVAAAYGACDSPAAMGGSYGCELSVKLSCRGSADPAGMDNPRSLSSMEPGLTCNAGESFFGTCPQRAGTAAATRVRASMDCAYPWGSASTAPSIVSGTTMESVLKVAQESPGLVLAWFLVPLPLSTILRKGKSLARATAASGGGVVNGTGEEISTTPEYVVIVLPLVCDSEVTTLLTHPLQSSVLLGGTRCGRIVQWSITQAWAHVAPRRLLDRALATTGTTTTLLLPPQRPAHSTFPSPQAHQAPVLRMAIHGDASCHHLYSISQEGKVCIWPAWQPLHPTASRLSYLGIRPMGNIGVAAQFVERTGTDAMTKVFIGTTSGALLVGTSRDAKSIELQYYGPSRALPTSSTVIRTLDITAASAYPSVAVAASTTSPRDVAGATASTASTASLEHAAGAERSPSPGHSGCHGHNATRSWSLPTVGGARAAPPPAPPPHHGRIVSMALQTAVRGVLGHDCVVSAATDGRCVAWFDRFVVPLEGFSSAVTSVCWSPTRSGVLAAGDAGGLVTLWLVNTSIITPVVTVSLREAGRRTCGNASSDGVLWVVTRASDGAAVATGGNFGLGDDDDGADILEGEETNASLCQVDVVGAAISSLFFSSDGRWLFASTASGYVHALHLSASMA
ncbi:hypothetical protein JKF63_06759 [Porcisia hertigi]|uniref:Uncharacterized protein n=1 Tax=Porcisia hertigi TaxID=2761500 RepID=A0A836LEV7_9TRYP|nr:hypothetical protein JKF63_06759 [Porcisia hertigi]